MSLETTSPNTDIAAANDLFGSAPVSSEAKRARRPNRFPRQPRKAAPNERLVLADGRPAMLVELTGAAAQGRSFLINPDDWHAVRSAFGHSWYLMNGPRGAGALGGIVVGLSEAAQDWARAAGQRGKDCRAPLARIIIGLKEATGRVVRFRNGNTRDLRRENLMPLPKATARHWQPDRPVAVVESLQ